MKTKQSRIDSNMQWLQANAEFLSIRRIELELQMPAGTLAKFVQGTRELPGNWKEPLSAWIDQFRK